MTTVESTVKHLASDVSSSQKEPLQQVRESARKDAELDEALNDLERMLDAPGDPGKQHDAGKPRDDGEPDLFGMPPAVESPASAGLASPPGPAALSQGLDETPPWANDDATGTDTDEDDHFWDAALSARVAERIANELEVITQACLEQSLERALEQVSIDVRRRIREHIAIVLPEILEEMAREAFDPREDDPFEPD